MAASIPSPAPQPISVEQLSSIPLFDGFDPGELRSLSRRMILLRLPKGQFLFREGDKGDHMCFILEGSLDVIKQSEQGKSVVIAEIPKGRTMGEMALVDDFPRSATVVAHSDAALAILTRKDFEAVAQSFPVIGFKVLKAIARLLSLNLRRTSGRLADSMDPG